MERVLVSISRARDQEIDLDLPAEVTADTLVKELAFSLGWEDSLEVLIEPLGRVLGPSETLAQAGIQDGARLLLQPRGSSAAPLAPSPSPETPFQGWRPLFQTADPSASSTPPPAELPPSPSGGFIWKQVDED